MSNFVPLLNPPTARDPLKLYTTQDLNMLRDGTHKFAQQDIAPFDLKWSFQDVFPPHLWKTLGENLFLGITAPLEYGGAGMGYLAHVIVTEIIARASGSIGLSYLAHSNLCVNQIALNGSEEQKEKYLPGLVSGELIGALAMSEAMAGSDVMSMRTRAERTDDGYVLNGSKLWITNGGTADVIVLYAKTGDQGKISTFIVTKDMKGFSVGQKIHKNGVRASDTYEILVNDCFVPEANRLGAEDKGGAVLMSGLGLERLILAAWCLGLAQASLDAALDYTSTRTQFGRPINSNQAVAHELADYTDWIIRERKSIYATAAEADMSWKEIKSSVEASKNFSAECSGVFETAATIATTVANGSLVLHGGMGMTQEARIGTILNDAKLGEIGGGAKHIRKEIVARQLLGIVIASHFAPA